MIWTLEETNERLAPYGVRIDPLLYSTDYIATLADRPDCWGRFSDWTIVPPLGRYNWEHPGALDQAWADHAAYLRQGTIPA